MQITSDSKTAQSECRDVGSASKTDVQRALDRIYKSHGADLARFFQDIKMNTKVKAGPPAAHTRAVKSR